MKRYLSVFLVVLSCLVGFSSCDEDIMDEITLQGKEWRVGSVSGYSPYEVGDRFSFYSNNRFVVTGNDGMVEYGTWHVKKKKLQMHFEGSSYNVDFEAPIPFLDDDHCVLDCYDYVYDTHYQLSLYYLVDLG